MRVQRRRIGIDGDRRDCSRASTRRSVCCTSLGRLQLLPLSPSWLVPYYYSICYYIKSFAVLSLPVSLYTKLSTMAYRITTYKKVPPAYVIRVSVSTGWGTQYACQLLQMCLARTDRILSSERHSHRTVWFQPYHYSICHYNKSFEMGRAPVPLYRCLSTMAYRITTYKKVPAPSIFAMPLS